MKLGEISLITCAKELAGSHFAVEDERITFRVKLLSWTEVRNAFNFFFNEVLIIIKGS
jgi:hypothetical protein